MFRCARSLASVDVSLLPLPQWKQIYSRKEPHVRACIRCAIGGYCRLLSAPGQHEQAWGICRVQGVRRNVVVPTSRRLQAGAAKRV